MSCVSPGWIWSGVVSSAMAADRRVRAVRMIFNVGARRSGTYWLQRIVCAHPAVAEVPSETYVFSHGVAPLMERFQHDERGIRRRSASVYADRERLIGAVRNLCDTVFGEFAGRW